MFGKKPKLRDMILDAFDRISIAVNNMGKRNEETRTTLFSNLDELAKKVAGVEAKLSIQNTELKDSFIPKVNKIDEVELKVEQKLNKFYMEFTDKYFAQMSAFIRWNKEMSLVSYFQQKTGDGELGKMKQALMKPFLDDKWAVNKAERAEQVNQILKTQGNKLHELRKKLHDMSLVMDREKRDTTVIRAQIKLIDMIIGGKL